MQTNTEINFEELKTLLQTVRTLVQTNPHIQHYLFESFQHLPQTSEESNGIQQAQNLADILIKVQSHLPIENEDTQINTKNIHIFYSLLAKYAQKPEALVRIIHQFEDAQFAESRIHFTLRLISQLLNARHSFENVQALVETINTFEEPQFQLFSQMYQYPPYVPIQDWLAWNQHRTVDIQKKYKQFLLEPFGVRRLDYTFNRQQYQRQRALFHGLIRNGELFSANIFTDELGLLLDSTLSENRAKYPEELQAIFHTAVTEGDTVAMLCAAVELLARTTSQQDLDSTRIISQECNTTQVMALYALLTNPAHQTLAQIDTGEGKSRMMMILAACKAALGHTVDFDTNDMPLVERDFFTYKDYFDTLEIETSIMTLQTPSFLYQKRGINFSDTQLLLLRNKSDIDGNPFAYLDEDPTRRCLLLDECDQFKQSKSKNAFNYGAYSIRLKEFSWVYSYLIKFMQTQPEHESYTIADCQNLTDNFLHYVHTHDADPLHVAQLGAFHIQYPNHLAIWLHSADIALNTMQFNNDYTITEQLFPMKNDDGHMQMSHKIWVLNDGRPAPEAIFADGLHQCLAALQNIRAHEELFVIPPECETQRTIFPITFMAPYQQGCVIGTSGTTRSAGPIADSAINYEDISYLSIPREKPLRRKEKNVWVAKDETQQVQFIKQVIQEKLANHLPALFVCKNDEQSQELYQLLSQDPDLATGQFSRVHSLTNNADEFTAVQQAGKPGHITFSTAGMFSRGVDIISDDLYVGATYVPSIEDEIQIKGRTGRIGKLGTFQMILDLSDPDIPLSGRTYNIDNEIDKYQTKLALESIFQEETSKIYALFLEEITQIFLATRPTDTHLESWLLDWRDLLSQMQKDWEVQRETMLTIMRHQDQENFENLFNAFTENWLTRTYVMFPNAKPSTQHEAIRELSSKIFTSTVHQVTFFQPKRRTIKTQYDYDPSDDGQARIYEKWFAKTRATLSGKRRIF